MGIEVLFPPNAVQEDELVGILTTETKLCGIINNRPIRRHAMPFETFELAKKNNRTLRVYIRDGDLNIVNVTGCTAVLEIRHSDDAPVLITKSTATPAQGAIGSPDRGEVFFYLIPTDTASLDVAQYVYRIHLTLPSGKTYTVSNGVINLGYGAD